MGQRINILFILGDHRKKSGKGEGERIIISKSFNISLDLPFDISDKTFEIRYNDDMNSDSARNDQIDAYPGHGGQGTSPDYYYTASSTTPSNITPGRSYTTELIDTYYIYTFEKKRGQSENKMTRFYIPCLKSPCIEKIN
jgi:hypothetical protein